MGKLLRNYYQSQILKHTYILYTFYLHAYTHLELKILMLVKENINIGMNIIVKIISMNFLMDIAYWLWKSNCNNRYLKKFRTLIIRLISGAQWFSVVSHSHVTTSPRSCLQTLSLITSAWNVEGRVKHSFLLAWRFFKTGSCI